MSFYRAYHLSDNPFPPTPILNPISNDDRINGAIYNPNIMTDEIRSLKGKIRRRPPLIYIENSDFVRGVGKSALIVQQWRQLQETKSLTGIYVRSEKKLKPADFAARLINHWHQDGYLWSALLSILAAYAQDTSDGEITLAGVQALTDTFQKLPLRTLSLSYFMVYNPEQLITDLAAWAHRQLGDGLPLDLAYAFFHSYLTDPRTFPSAYPKTLRKYKWDNIAMIAAVYHLLQLGGYTYHYLFFDQFEDVVHGLAGQLLITFNTEMRRLMEASIGWATMIVTLHPGANATLHSAEGGDIVSIAPLDQRHVVTVWPLKEGEASLLAQTYLDHFRLSQSPPPHALYPFTKEAIEKICVAFEGNVRACLQAFNYAIEKGADEDFPPIDDAFLDEHHAEITGRVQADKITLTEVADVHS